MIVVALVFAVLCLILAAALRRNTTRARFWQDKEGVIDDRFVFLMLPGAGVGLLGLGLLALSAPLIGGGVVPSIIGVTCSFFCALAIIFGVALLLLGLFSSRVPTWALPRSDRK